MTINTVGREFLGDGSVGRRRQAARRPARHASPTCARTTPPPFGRTDLDGLDANLDNLLEVRARNGARSNRLESALSRLAEVEEATIRQLSETEDADIAKTLIELNSQQAAYQAALRAGAELTQSSLLDFLR